MSEVNAGGIVALVMVFSIISYVIGYVHGSEASDGNP